MSPSDDAFIIAGLRRRCFALRVTMKVKVMASRRNEVREVIESESELTRLMR